MTLGEHAHFLGSHGGFELDRSSDLPLAVGDLGDYRCSRDGGGLVLHGVRGERLEGLLPFLGRDRGLPSVDSIVDLLLVERSQPECTTAPERLAVFLVIRTER